MFRLFNNRTKKEKLLKELIGFYPGSMENYRKSFQHKTYNLKDNYERLEFLGDSVLNQIVSEELFKKNKKDNEGDLSKERSKIVSRKNLNQIAKKIIPKELIKNNLKKISENIYGNILESLIAAIYLEKGYEKTKRFIKKRIIQRTETSKIIDYKSRVLEWAQKNKKTIQFKIIKRTSNTRYHQIQLLIDDMVLSEISSSTIKSAEQKASKIAYNQIY